MGLADVSRLTSTRRNLCPPGNSSGYRPLQAIAVQAFENLKKKGGSGVEVRVGRSSS
ncbi:hypothetical protein BDZ91DRAFT_724965 [Kalaharituber pfeilii]|nr:hypothetical protein BDZ91DRAFT_724965 [Kalaharituber pfeilii]